MSEAQSLIEKLQALPRERIAEVEDFVDFLAFRERQYGLVRAADVASAPAFAVIWNNPDDDAYDAI